MSVLATLPKVTGRHRNHALAAARRATAVELVTQGMTYRAIAHELGYANPGTVHRIVHQALDDRVAENVDLLRLFEVDRLDALQAALWGAAMTGDVAAGTAALRIIMARVKILGLAGGMVQQADSGCRLVVCPQAGTAHGHSD